MNGDYPKMDEESKRIRGERGWAPSDIWSMDDYLCFVLAPMLREMKGSGAPDPLTFEQWDDILEEMAIGFDRWGGHFELHDREDEDAAYKAVRRSLTLMRRYFGSLWT